MEPNVDVLLGIAEVAVAFVGISTLVSVIGARAREKALLDLARLKSVIYISLLAVASSLLPIAANEYGLDHRSGWRLVSIIALSLNLMLLIYTIRAGGESGLHSADKLYVWLGYGSEPAVQLAIWMNALGLYHQYASAFYLTFCILLLFQAAIAFLLLLNSLFFEVKDEHS